MKYVIVEYYGHEMPFVFPDLPNHSDVARSLGGKVTGAGFCFYNEKDSEWNVYGKSTSTGLASKPEDAELLNRRLRES
jgi:SLT domain-containing protein